MHCSLTPMIGVVRAFSGGLDSAVLLAARARRSRAGLAHPRARRASRGKTPSARAIDRLLDASPFAGRIEPAHHALARHARRLPGDALGGHRTAAGLRHARRRRLSRRSQHRAASRRRRCCARDSAIGGWRWARSPDNPFPDATPEFFSDDVARDVARPRLAQPFAVVTPLVTHPQGRRRPARRDLGVPLELTMSCMNPAGDRHCGQCSKCRERIDAFRLAGVTDPTEYASTWEGSKV